MSTTDVTVYAEPAQSDLEQWGRDLATAYQMARQLVTTSFVPESYKGKPEEAAAAIVTGAELGLSPMASLRSIDIIHGTPGMRAIALRALVQSKGHEIWVDESTAERAVVKGRRKGSDKVETSTWNLDRARGLQLLGKDNWKKQPIAMLLARATSELARLIAADVLLGIPYSIEELEDLGKDEAPAVGAEAVKKPASRSVRRAALDPGRGEAPAPDGADESPMVGAVERGAARAAAETAPDGDAADAERLAQIAAEELAREQNELARAAAAAAFESAPVDLQEPPIDWEGPR